MVTPAKAFCNNIRSSQNSCMVLGLNLTSVLPLEKGEILTRERERIPRERSW